ncbi:MAG: hypothetical protein OXC05_15765 [Halieaceae bacterium]|nr:hypothetical protein [Halieaceae bacterium]
MNRFPTASRPVADSEPALAALLEQLLEQYRGAVNCVLVYGSCLRSGDLHDGLLDLYLICDDYRSAYGSGLLAMANRLLPPNVFYAEVSHENRILRCKYALLSSAQLARRTKRSTMESYFWGRFAQPVAIAWQRDEESRRQVEKCLLTAVTTLLRAALPALPASASVQQLWQQALGLSYRTELRTESSARTAQLSAVGASHFEQVTRLAQEAGLPLELWEERGSGHYRSHCNKLQRAWARLTWPLRTAMGKPRSILRLVKALFTFAGGLDYIAWKLERHSGQQITVPPKVRKRPLLYCWGFFWKLYRRGVFK